MDRNTTPAGHGQNAGHHASHTGPTGHTGNADHSDHGGHAGHDPAIFRDRFWLSLALAIPVVATSPLIMTWFGYTLDFPRVEWIAPVLGTVIVLYGGWPFLTGAVAEARGRQPGMMLLIGMAISVAFVASMSASLGLFAVEV